MYGKRKREGSAQAGSQGPGSRDGSIKPMSAVAAARLRLRPEPTPDVSLEPPSLPEVSASSELDESDAEPEALEPQQNVQLCTWRFGQDYVSSESDEHLTVSLKKNTTIALIGCFDFNILRGAVNINGANFEANVRKSDPVRTHRAFVPSTHPISTIKGLDSQNEIQFLDCDEPTPLAALSPLFANIWNAKSRSSRPRSFALMTDSDADPLKRLIVPELAPEDWMRQIEETATPASATLITGTPSSGISTFGRRLLNRYLTGLGKSAKPVASVFYLDLDSNKPAYSPHGQISLTLVRKVDLSPPFTRPSTIPNSSGENESIRAHPLPLNGIAEHPEYFLSCVKDLVHTYRILKQQNPSTPLIVNTPGRLYAATFSVLLQVLAQIRPQRLVHLTNLQSIDEEYAAKLDALDVAARKNAIIIAHVSSQSNIEAIPRADADLRSMHMLSYFHCTGQSKIDRSQLTFSPKPLSYSSPWEFCYENTNKSNQAFTGFLMLSDWTEPSQLFTALNGSIIQIVETEDASIHEQFGSLPRTNKFRIPYFGKSPSGAVDPLEPRTSRLVCTALIRGWDPENRTVQVIVPKTHEVLMHGLKPEKTVFVFGCCENPEWAYTEGAHYQLSEQMKAGQVDQKAAVKEVACPPWVATTSSVEEMAYMNTTRRIRKFL